MRLYLVIKANLQRDDPCAYVLATSMEAALDQVAAIVPGGRERLGIVDSPGCLSSMVGDGRRVHVLPFDVSQPELDDKQEVAPSVDEVLTTLEDAEVDFVEASQDFRKSLLRVKSAEKKLFEALKEEDQ